MSDDSIQSPEQLRQELVDLRQSNSALRQQRAVEQAAERLREHVLAMRTSEDLYSVAASFLVEVRHLGIDTLFLGIVFFEGEQIVHHYPVTVSYAHMGLKLRNEKDPAIKKVTNEAIIRDIPPDQMPDPWKLEPIRAFQTKSVSKVRNYLDDSWLRNDWIGTESNLKQAIAHWSGEWIRIHIPFSHGAVGFNSRTDNEEQVKTVTFLAEVFSLGYMRFLDLQHLESQNRALERTLQEKERVQEALVRSESLAAIGTLAAGAAHELNNPIGAAASLVQTVQEMVEENSAEELVQDREMIVENLAFSRKELTRAKDIVASLLDLSHQSQDYTEEVDLRTVAQDALRGLHGRYDTDRVTIEEEYQADLPTVQGNFSQLVQLPLNLIGNAIDALDDEAGTLTLKTYAAGDQVFLECRDTGVGMSDKVRQDIFKPFFTTKAPGAGTGLGLYVCHQIVERHGGTMDVDSTEGLGTTVRVRLPIA